MTKINIAYYVITGLLSLALVPGAVMNAMSTPESLEVFRAIGMPDYICPFMGVAKILGVIAIWIPGYPRIKEWAYAGIFFDLFGATYGAFVSGLPPDKSWPMLVFVAMILAAYFIYHKRLSAKTSAAA
jgi:hypothetical protein